MKKLLTIMYGVVLSAFGSLYAQPGQSSSSAGSSVTLHDVIEISATAVNANFDFSTSSHYLNGIEQLNAASVVATSNKPFSLKAKAATANFSSASATPMPASILSIRLSSGSYVSLTTNDQTLSGNQARGHRTLDIDYKANPGFDYDGDSYSLDVVYTATQQ